MASMTLVDAAKLSRNPLANAVMRAVSTTDELISQLPMVQKSGESFVYNREKALGSVDWIEMTDTITEDAATFDRVTVPMRIIGKSVDVYNFAEEQMGEAFNHQAIQVVKKAKATGRAIGDKAVNGAYVTGFVVSAATVTPGLAIDAVTVGPGLDSGRQGPGSIKYTHTGTLWQFRAPGDAAYGPTVAAASDGDYVLRSDNPSRWIIVTLDVSDATADGVTEITFSSTSKEADGLKKLIDSSQVIASTGASGDALSFAVLDSLIDEKVKVRENLRFIMNGKLKAKYFALVRALGGATAETIALPGLAWPVPHYRGIPILQNDNIASNEAKGAASTLSSVYLVSLSADEGFYAGCGGGEFNADVDPRSRMIMGLRVRDIGQLEDKDAHRTRVTWYGAFALGSDLAAARAKEIITA